MKRLAIIVALLASSAQPALAYAGAVAAPAPEISRPGVRDYIRSGIASLATALTNVGVAVLVDRIQQSGTAGKNIGWGTGTTTAAVTQTALVTEAAPTTAGGRTVGTEGETTTDQTGDTYTVTGTVTAGSTLAITEEGLFTATSNGTMLLRGDFSAVNVVSGDSIAFTNKIKIVPSAA